MALHDHLELQFRSSDRLVYLGNLIGRGRRGVECINELLQFRRAVLARHGTFPDDIVFLRGAQEEMWQKLMQLQFARDPKPVFEWMLAQGLENTLRAYGFDPADGFTAMREGVLSITRWTTRLRARVNAMPGHAALWSHLRRAALIPDGSLLFVHTGADPDQPLDGQSDSLWWGGSRDPSLWDRPFEPFSRIVRGYDPHHAGLVETAFATSIDAGCGFGGSLVAACFAQDGRILEQITV